MLDKLLLYHIYFLFADDSLLFCKANIQKGGTIKKVFIDYERASGQCTNYYKSSMMFSSNVVSNCLEMREVSNLGNYLGVPSHFLRNKVIELQFIM